MKQRVPRRAWYSGRSLDRPRVLVESASPALAVSDFSVFQDAGFDVGVCSGPGGTPEDCPLLRGEECALLEGADAVLHKLDQPLDIAAAIHRQRPDIPVLVEVRRGADGSMPAVPAGCVPLPYPCSVRGQVDALRQHTASRSR
jgi:hypothetical protein